MEAAGQGGEAVVAIQSGPGSVSVTVSDDGPGIPADRIERVGNSTYADWNATFTSVTAFRSWESQNGMDIDFTGAGSDSDPL